MAENPYEEMIAAAQDAADYVGVNRDQWFIAFRLILEDILIRARQRQARGEENERKV